MPFRSIRERWRETRGPQLGEDLNFIADHMGRLSGSRRQRMYSMVRVAMEELEAPFAARTRRQQLKIIKRARARSKSARNPDDLPDCIGLALVHTYLESTITPGIVAAKARFVSRGLIDEIMAATVPNFGHPEAPVEATHDRTITAGAPIWGIARWLLVLPVALACAAGLALVLVLVAVLVFGPLFDEENLPAKGPLWLQLMGMAGLALVGLTFAYVGSVVAPRHKLATATGLAMISVIAGLRLCVKYYEPGDYLTIIHTMSLPAGAVWLCVGTWFRHRRG